MSYTYTQFRSRVNAGIKGKIGVLIDDRQTLNDVVREVISDIDLRTTIRKNRLSPGLFKDTFEYACPSDLKGQAIIDIIPQSNNRRTNEYDLTTSEEFRNRGRSNKIAIEDNDLIRKILINSSVADDLSLVLDELDNLDGWSAFGDADNLELDRHNYVRGSASIKFDINSDGNTTAGIEKSNIKIFDLTRFLGFAGEVITWAYITDVEDITNFTLRIGSSSGNYYQKSITAQSDGTEFRTGWNLLRFNLSNLTTVGTPINTQGSYIALYMTKDATKIDQNNFAFDQILLKRGEVNDVLYYSKFGWRTEAGIYIENSTSVSDILNADTDEFNLFVSKGVEMAGAEVDEIQASEKAARDYLTRKQKYLMSNPSRAKNIIQEYADFINTF